MSNPISETKLSQKSLLSTCGRSTAPCRKPGGYIPEMDNPPAFPPERSTASTPPHHALKSVVDQRLLPHNPADHVAPLKVAHKSMTILNEEQLDAFLTAVKQDAVRKAFFYTELTTSLRLGEICGLM